MSRFHHSRWPAATRLALWGLLGIGLAGCSSDAPRLDAQWGQSMAQARAQQTAYPERKPGARGPIETDAVIGRLGIERYHQSFENPPPPVNVLQLGVGGAGVGAAR